MPTSIQTYIVLLPLLTLIGGDAVPADLPRYSLPVGRKLVYSLASESKNKDGTAGMSSKGTFQITVVRENANGSRRVIIRSASSYNQQGYQSPEQVSLAYADVFPDGTVLPNASLGMKVDLSTAFPPLPKDAEQLQKGWSQPNEAKLQTTNFKARESDAPGDFVFAAAVEGVLNKIYQTTYEYTYHFDRAKGMISKVHSTYSQDYGFHQKGVGTTKLESDQMIPAAEIATLAADFDLFFNASGKYEEMMADVNKHPEHAEKTLADAKEMLIKARTDVKTADASKELSRMIASHDQYATYAKESAGKFKEILNKPAPTWESTDIDGKPLKLADLRGKVVVMDFWYRGCGWCMYAMPQVIKLSEEYKDKGVVVLGMNTDRDEKDARVVIDAMGMKYATIKATGIPQKYGVQGFPTLIIIDREGVVRDVHVGYSPKLREEVGKKLDELVATAKVGG
jgi:thiol-disulfide isomerase/thioredoxin